MTAIDMVRILVLGDSGVGKTSLVHLIAHNEPIKSPSWTVGCSVEVKLHEYKEGTRDQKAFFIEMMDVGGSNNHRNERHVFYNPCHGVILVYDLTNTKSEANLHKWLKELLNKNTNCFASGMKSFDEFDSESFLGSSQFPILIVGTKLSQALDRKHKIKSFADQVGADEILLDSHQVRYLAPGTSNSVKLSRFFDKVIDYRCSSDDSFSEKFNPNNSTSLPSKFYYLHQD